MPPSTAHPTDPGRLANLRVWNMAVGLAVLAQAALILVLSNDFAIPIVGRVLRLHPPIRETADVFLVDATKKLLDRCGGPAAHVAPTTTALGDCCATALFWRPQVALFVNEPTRLPVLVPLAPAPELVPRFVAALGNVMASLDIDLRPELCESRQRPWS